MVNTFFQLGAVLDSVNGPGLGVESTREGGLRTIAFHPDYNHPGMPGYHKFYSSQMETTAGGNPDLPYLGPTDTTNIADSVVGEWTVGANGQVDPNSYREVFRVALPWFAHPGKQIAFNPFSQPGDEDYGLLYYGHGDAGQPGPPVGTGQHPFDARGKILRINPLQDGANRFTVPASNPFTATYDPGDVYLDEIYALGFRNPHRFSWAKDDQGIVQMIVTDIGEDNVEEINLVKAGGNYGWRLREGTFQSINNNIGTGLGVGIDLLPSNDWAQNNFIYPAAQYGHDGTGSTSPPRAIAGGFVIQNGSDPALQGQYVFSDFPETATLFHVSLDELLASKTTLANFELPSALTPAPLQKLGVLFDDDSDPSTPALDTTLNDVIRNDPDYEGGTRTEPFFYQGPRGEIYITNKRNGWIYLVTNSLPANADFDSDADVDGTDFLTWQRGVGIGSTLAEGDASGDRLVDSLDLAEWKTQYETQAASLSAKQVVNAAVPEPASFLLLAVVLVCMWTHRRRTAC